MGCARALVSGYLNLMRRNIEQLGMIGVLWVACSHVLAAPPPEPPSVICGELFEAVQLGGVFPDSKTFPDAKPKTAPNTIMDVAVQGLRRSGESDLGSAIAISWMRENTDGFRQTGKLAEKYDVTGSDTAKGGEYPTQDGFAWTNRGAARSIRCLSATSCLLPRLTRQPLL